jgi:hypothetical protein
MRDVRFNDRKTIQKPIPKKIKTATTRVTKNCGVAADRKSQLIAVFAPPPVLVDALWMLQTTNATVTRNAPPIEVAVPAMKAFRKFKGTLSRVETEV